MQDFAFEQVSDRGQIDVGMWPDIDAFPRTEFRWPHMIEKYPGTDHSLFRCWQQAPY
jgi:hypothetical protein